MRIFMKWCNASPENKELYFQLKHLYELRSDGLMPNDVEIMASWERLWKRVMLVLLKHQTCLQCLCSSGIIG